jgi:hypothetical protein
MLKTIVDHLAYRDAPCDIKEVAESVEFYLRTRKRLMGALQQQTGDQSRPITVYDLCSGHGLTGMLFAACNPPRGESSRPVRAVLIDQSEPPSHRKLRKYLAEICPWIDNEDTVQFIPTSLENFAIAHDGSSDDDSIVISTHACGSLTDQVLKYAVESGAAAVAVMPCCYTGTDKGVPYGIRRALGVAWSADIARSYMLNDHGYHSDFNTIPEEITPMNRILIGERKKK